MGVVIAYQAAEQLRTFGANIYIVDLVGISVLREIAPLVTAIIVAGRPGSAFTAQIGTMKVTEEVDALRTLGMSPLELLVLPKVLALIVAGAGASIPEIIILGSMFRKKLVAAFILNVFLVAIVSGFLVDFFLY